jgi:hypothetical protein
MRNVIRNVLLLSALGGVLSTALAADETATPRQRPTPEQRAQRQAQMQQRWNQLDANHDGKISREEAQQGAPKLAEHFDRLDANGDGQITPQEMRTARRAHKGERAPGAGGLGKPESRPQS